VGLLDEDVARVARRQHALITRAQAVAIGLAPSAIDHRRGSGRWRAITPGVYHLNGAPMTWRTKVMAACLATGGYGSHRTGAAMLGVRGFPEGVVEVSVRPGHRRSTVDAVQHERDDFERIVPIIVDGIPVTAPERLIADLGMSVPYARFEKAALQLVGAKVISWEDVLRSRLRYNRRGRDGSGALTELILRRAGAEVPESVLEQSLLFLLIESGLADLFEQQVEVHDHLGRFVMRADFGISRAKLLLECDSYEHHRFDPEAFEGDRRKRNEAELLGWDVLAFTSRQIVRTPKQTLRVIQRALRRHGI